MKKIMIAAALLIVGAGTASADPWKKSHHPYAERHHNVCQMKARELFEVRSRARSDGRVGFRERMRIRTLERDLDRTCGGFRRH